MTCESALRNPGLGGRKQGQYARKGDRRHLVSALFPACGPEVYPAAGFQDVACLTTSAIDSAYWTASRSLRASTITRNTGSVPEARISTRPVSFNAVSA